MRIKFSDLKRAIKTEKVFLPYSFVLEKLEESGKVKKPVGQRIAESTILTYLGGNLEEDLKNIRKSSYLVSVLNDNLPYDWISFNNALFDLANQCEKRLDFFVPFYDSQAVSFFADFEKLKIEKSIVLYPPEKHFERAQESASKALSQLRSFGFKCRFTKTGNHAKVYMFDDKAAIIGSFNFTERGIYQNTEIGALIFGEDVPKLRKFMETRTGD